MNDAVLQFTQLFDKQGWIYHQHGDKPVVHTNINGENGRWACMAVADAEGWNIAFFSLFPSQVPANRRAACAELLARINFTLKHGCFEMDFNDGEIRYRTSLPLTPEELTPVMLERLVFGNLITVDKFYGAIMKVLHGGFAPKAVLEKAEEKPSATPRFQLN